MTLDEARQHLAGSIDSRDGRLFSLGWYLSWFPGDEYACLDGDFTADDLEAIAVNMRATAVPMEKQ